MELKDYQIQALQTLDRYLDALKEARQQIEEFAALDPNTLPPVLREQSEVFAKAVENYPRVAWESLCEKSGLPGVPDENGENHIPEYISREAASGEPIPHVCLKVPTGGGKTLLGVEAVRRHKIGIGFLLWIVPTKAIYSQTLDAFRNQEHPYRQILDRASGDRVKLLEKDDRFTKQDVENHLCVMLLMLPSANREKNKEFLKIFRDSSGYDSFFPIEDDIRKHQALSEEHPDLETVKPGEPGQIRGMFAANPADRLIKQSLFNVLKLIRPTVILDEAHKAYGSKKVENNREFVKAVNRLNPRFVLELSATPQLGISNILVNISGTALKEEEMIKIPIQLRNYPNSTWKYTLAIAKTERDKLEEVAKQFQQAENRYIRPIAVIRVDRTGKKQRDGVKVHAEDARYELIKVLGVPEEHIKIKSSEQDELAGVDLLSPFCPVRYIITKDALKEGWDCPFAYQLALLDNTTAQTAMTQLIGRVMRQPHARATNLTELDTCYIYCYNQEVGKAVNNVKKGLEAEGLTGLAKYVESTDVELEKKSIQRRKKYRQMDIFLPQVLHKRGHSWNILNYERDILSAVDWGQLGAVKPVNLDDQELIQEIRATIHLQDHDETEKIIGESTSQNLEISFFVRRLNDVIPNPWQAARIVKATLQVYQEQGTDKSKLYANRLYLSEIMKKKLSTQIEKSAETIFREKLDNNTIRFSLETDVALNFELEKTIEVNISTDAKRLTRSDASPVQLNLFNPVYEAEFNNLEKDFALYLDKKDAIQWWHRIAARQGYFLQGWHRDRVYPDFIACVQGNKKGQQRLLIFETKGQHLEGNSDTTYKQELIKTLESAYKNATEYGTMEATGPNDKPMSFRMLLEDTWRETVNETIDDIYTTEK
ncbi:DEAD/DEAH box helicase family protein [Candidatus Poribacteria bacterium]|nr:DEAD/DEAH box helicase family protein [Candidatus Poribacteria bacterium]